MSIHVAITRHVRPGSEKVFEEKLARFAQESLSYPGTRGVQLLHPTPGSDLLEYGILRSFATEADRDAFYHSPMYRQWEKDIQGIVEGEPENRDLHGLEAWFRQPDLPRPPRWKMALATLVGVYPTSLFLTIFLAPHLHALPRALGSLIFAGVMVTLLTWVMMPFVTKVLHPWLKPANA